jgi:hypothetical protein
MPVEEVQGRACGRGLGNAPPSMGKLERMPVVTIPNSTLDAVLAIQLTVAWAGESKQAGRLGWWQTDLMDARAGGDLLRRLLPRTHAWAAFEGAREAARRTEQEALAKLADRDRLRTLFFLGFDPDERLAERIAELKRGGVDPETALPFPLRFREAFTPAALEAALGKPKQPAYEVVPGGRLMRSAMPPALDLAAKNLAAALFPLPEHYPLPFYKVATGS